MSESPFGKYSTSGKLFASSRKAQTFPRRKKMPLNPHLPLIYLITSGQTTAATAPSSSEFTKILKLVEAAVSAGVDLVQLREKNLRAKVLYQLSLNASSITAGTTTKLLVNDRADLAAASGADGVHLTTRSLPTRVVRSTFGDRLLIGVSTHSFDEVMTAREDGADFVVFGPVFEVVSKLEYGKPQGVNALKNLASSVAPFPVIALGGVATGNVAECLKAGARGVAGIRMFEGPSRLSEVVTDIRNSVVS